MKEERDSDFQECRETELGLSTTQGDSSEQQGGSGDKVSMWYVWAPLRGREPSGDPSGDPAHVQTTQAVPSEEHTGRYKPSWVWVLPLDVVVMLYTSQFPYLCLNFFSYENQLILGP